MAERAIDEEVNKPDFPGESVVQSRTDEPGSGSGEERDGQESDGATPDFPGEDVDSDSSTLVESLGSAAFGFNRGLANVAGLPVDALNAAAGLVGLEAEEPILGSKNLKGMLAEIGAAPAVGEETEQPFLARVGEEFGAASVPFGALGSIARTSRQGGRLLGPVLQSFRAKPGRNAGVEATSATGAGTAAATAQQVDPGNEEAEVAAQLFGGLASPAAIFSRSGPETARKVRRTLSTFTPKGAEREAARQLRQVVRDPKGAAQRLEGEADAVEGAALTPAQETQDPGLLALERSLIRRSAEVEQRFDDLARQTQQALRNEGTQISGDVPVERTREFLQERQQRLKDLLDARTTVATQNAQNRLSELEGTPSRGELGRVAREEFEKALNDASRQEQELFARVNEEASAPTTNAKQALESELAARRKADDPADLPDFVTRTLSGDNPTFGDTENLGELQSFRSRLLRSIRGERASEAPNRNKIRILENVQRGVLDDMAEAADETTEVGQDLQTALDFSRQLNEKFRQGPVGRLLNFERSGGEQVAPEATLERIIGSGGPEAGANAEQAGPEAGANAEQAREATRFPARSQQENPALAETEVEAAPERFDEATADFLREAFVRQTTNKDGRVISQSADRFLRRNEELLSQFPQLRQQLEQAKSARQTADQVAARNQARKRGLQDRQRSRAALFLDAPVGREINRVLRSRDPATTMGELVRQSRRDLSGEALGGLRSAFLKELLGRAELETLDQTGARRLSGERLRDLVSDNREVIAESGLFTKDQVGRIDRLVRTAQKAESGRANGRSVEEILDESPDAFLDLVSRIVGANVGAASAAGTTGAPIVAAGAGSRFVRNLTNRVPVARTRDVLSQAVVDRDLMRTLLQRMGDVEQSEPARQQLNAFLANILPPEEVPEEEDQEAEG